jgi:hypothetical protein
VTLLVDNDWTAGDRIKVIQSWLEHAGRKYPHLKTDLPTVAALLGHSRLDTVRVYSQPDEAAPERAAAVLETR